MPGGPDGSCNARHRHAGTTRDHLVPKMRIRSRHSRLSVPTNRSANAFASGALIGVRTILRPSERITSSKRATYLAYRSREEAKTGRLPRAHEVARLLGHPGGVGIGGDAGEVHSASSDLNEKERIETTQEHGAHGQEVASDDACCLAVEEFPPGKPRPPRGGVDSFRTQNRPLGAGRDRDPEVFEALPGSACSPRSGCPRRGGSPATNLCLRGRAALAARVRPTTCPRARGAIEGPSRDGRKMRASGSSAGPGWRRRGLRGHAA